jgi:hypothetical protein
MAEEWILPKYGNHVLNLPIEVEEIHRSDPDTYVDTNIQG